MNTSTAVRVPLTKSEKARLSRLALRYGLSLPEFSRRVLQELTAEVPEESLSDYADPKALKISLNRALRDYRAGRVRTRL